MILRGYIDESGDSELFTLSCVITNDFTWFHFSNDWQQCIGNTNDRLRQQGRRQITRLHAADCSNRHGEYEGWTGEEQARFAQDLLTIFEKYRIDVPAHTLNLRELAKTYPIVRPNPRGFAYVLLLRFLLSELCRETLRREKRAVAHLIHDRCDYDAALQESFRNMTSDERFRCRERFTVLTSASWRECVPLQAADLLAYENFKEHQRRSTKRAMRASLRWLATQSQLGGYARGFDTPKLQELRYVLDHLDHRTKQLLLEESRISTPPRSKNQKP
jgi:hypothetical protein